MDYSNLITRNSYEKIARGLGITNVASLSFAALETIVNEAQARQREEYRKVRDNLSHSFVLLNNGDANAAAVQVCDECDGEGLVEATIGNSPYDTVITCETCTGYGEIYLPETELRRAA